MSNSSKQPPFFRKNGSGKNNVEHNQDRKNKFGMPKTTKNMWWLWLPLVFVVGLLVWPVITGGGPRDIDTSQGMQLLGSAKIEQAKIEQGTNYVTLTLPTPYKPVVDGKPLDKGKIVRFQFLDAQGKDVAAAVDKAKPAKGYNITVPQDNVFLALITYLVPMLLLVGLFWLVMSRASGGAKMFGRSRAKMVDKETPTVSFKDVAGVDEAVEELEEIKEFIKAPKKFTDLGAKIPKGVLLYGPPGTGKTILARAVAGEAGVPFFHISASEFVELFVGVGASRVRDLFEMAKKNAPAIVFIDEIDGIGGHRGTGMGGGAEEREQTLNQLLVEMDGFDASTNVILIAATNRPDVLDQALIRPGRFDRQVAVDAPDLLGRCKILQVHAKGKPLAKDVDMDLVARRTPGFTGADLANVLNEAALLAARNNVRLVDMHTIDEAIDRVMGGPQRRTRLMSDKEKLMTAYHEGGHALAAAALHHTDPVTKVTILPRGKAIGYTMVMPTEDRYSVSRNQLLDQLVYAMGGRVAEEVVFHDPTTGASNDIEKATAIAYAMVTEYGMSDTVGAVRLKPRESNSIFGRMESGRDYSQELSCVVDKQVHELIENAHTEAWEIITRNRHVIDRLVTALLDKETLLEGEIKEIFQDIIKQPERELWLSSPHRPVQYLPLVEVPKAHTEASAADETVLDNPAAPMPQAPATPIAKAEEDSSQLPDDSR